MTPDVSASLAALRARSRFMETTWLATLLVALVALAAPWYLRSLDIQLGTALWCAVGYVAVVSLLGLAQERISGRRALLASAWAGQVVGVVFFALLWHLVGGVENPIFLLAFFIPIATASVLLPRALAAGTTLLAVAAALGVAVAESAELRWYLIQLGIPIERLAFVPRAALPSPFRGAATGPAFQLTGLALFGVLLPATFVTCERLAARLSRVARREAVAAHALAGEAQALFQAALQAQPAPSVLVYADSAEVVEASRSFVNQMLLRPDAVAGRPLTELLRFADPEAVLGLLALPKGELSFCAYAVGEERRMARVRCYRFGFGHEQFACLSLEDRDALFYLSHALDGLDDPVLLVRDGGQVAYHNRAALHAFPGLHFGGDAAELLGAQAEPALWEGSGGPADPAGPFEVSRIPGEPGEALTLLRIRPDGAA